MGLAVEVGSLGDSLADPEAAVWLHQQIEAINRTLARAGLPAHAEPTGDDLEVVSLDLFGYSGLHYLRRFAVHLDYTGRLPPPGDESAPNDPLLLGCYAELQARRDRGPGRFGRVLRRPPRGRLSFPHLVNHSDAEGFYLPLDFREPLSGGVDGVAGDHIGSSPALVRELEVIAAELALPADVDPDSGELWAAVDNPGAGRKKWQRYGVESFVCQRLLHAARCSVRSSAMLVFA